jgi:hypothetical protein
MKSPLLKRRERPEGNSIEWAASGHTVEIFMKEALNAAGKEKAAMKRGGFGSSWLHLWQL